MKRTRTITGNTGIVTEVLVGLKEGQSLLCIKDELSESGLGLWSSQKYNSFEKGKIYKVDHLFNWDGVMVAYVLDEDGCLTWAKPETFDIIL